MSLYLAAYDISDDNLRQRVARVLEGYGHRLQYSVYEIWLDPEEVRGLCREIGPLLERSDKFQLFPLDERGTRSRISWQEPGEQFDPVLLL